jgi:hypothetical protein
VCEGVYSAILSGSKRINPFSMNTILIHKGISSNNLLLGLVMPPNCLCTLNANSFSSCPNPTHSLISFLEIQTKLQDYSNPFLYSPHSSTSHHQTVCPYANSINTHKLNFQFVDRFYKLHLETRICLQVLPSCSYPKSYLEVAQCISNVWILNSRFLANLTHSSPDDDCLNLVLSLHLPELPLHSVTTGILCNFLDLSYCYRI